MWPPVDMTERDGRSDDDIEFALEKYYVGAQHYLIPGEEVPPVMRDAFGADWGLNARGIYYRHFYSTNWVTAGHDLWLPSVDDVHWSHTSEDGRRARAENLLKHIVNNENWKKSEYAWEADAWQDVFGLMRNDRSLAVDKHEYNAIKQKRHQVSCLLDGQPKFVKRIPDATFGLATFKPTDYIDSLAEWDLDHDRLEALLFHRHCGLISDPQWGNANLVFPFAAYEAKGWSGDVREARRQACSAGAAYLDLLDNLARKPGTAGGKNRPFQSAQSCNNQVFVFTSFGAHWHILVGYKRPRLKREYAGHKGLSESVYVFQRIWSGRIVTKRKAWELLSLIDQIHSWGVTDHRDYVIRHLKAWHEFGRICYANDLRFLMQQTSTDKFRKYLKEHSKSLVLAPDASLQLADWANHFTENSRAKLRERAMFHFWEAYRRDAGVNKDDMALKWCCVKGDCGPAESPGYPWTSREEYLAHCREAHSCSDAEMAAIGCFVKEQSDLDKRRSHSEGQIKRSASGEPGPPTKRYKSSCLEGHLENDVGKGKTRVIDLTND